MKRKLPQRLYSLLFPPPCLLCLPLLLNATAILPTFAQTTPAVEELAAEATIIEESAIEEPLIDEYRLSGIERVVAIADIHGAYEPFVSLLQGSALVDDSLRWIDQQTHLVIVGDVLDRGDGSRQVLDLVMRLEQEAAAAGGAVHMVLGNHEIMNLSGELGYVTREEFSAYEDLEKAGMRRQAQSRFSAQVPGLNALTLRAAFGRQYPRGFFGHRAAFAADGLYGSWLLDKPVLLIINDTAFVHAGLSTRLLGPALAEVNSTAMTALRRYLDAMQVLQAAEVLFPETDFHKHAELVGNYLDSARANANPEVRAAAETLLETVASDPFSSDSPVWYRGMVDCSPALEQGRLQQLLDTLNVDRIVIGHTPTNNHLVQERFGNELIMADTGMLKDYYGGQPAALIFEGGEISVYYADDNTLAQPVPMPRLVGERPFSLDDDQLAEVLASAEIMAQSEAPNGMRRLTLRSANGTFDALFSPALANNGGAFIPAVAAYRLDRLLGLDMLPVAVRRELDGQTGAVYLEQGALPGQTEQSASAEAWCPISDQTGLMQVFDFLLNKRDRTAEQMHYMSGNSKLVLGIDSGILASDPPPLVPEGIAAMLSPFLSAKLAALGPEQLEQVLGDVLDAEHRQALLARRDLMLNSRGQ